MDSIFKTEDGNIIYRTASTNNKFNEKYKIQKGETFDLEKEPSLTIPDQAMSVKELLQRFTRGGEVKVLQPQFQEGELENEFELDLNLLDRMERLELLEATKENIAAMQLGLQQKAVPKPEIQPEQAESQNNESSPE